jgi:hypothetical protein
MAEHVSKTADCGTCGDPIQYVDGIRDPYWQHVNGLANHNAKPAPGTIRETIR